MVQVHVEKGVETTNVIWMPKLNALFITMFSSRLSSVERRSTAC